MLSACFWASSAFSCSCSFMVSNCSFMKTSPVDATPCPPGNRHPQAVFFLCSFIERAVHCWCSSSIINARCAIEGAATSSALQLCWTRSWTSFPNCWTRLTSSVFIIASSWWDFLGLDDTSDSFGKMGRWRSMVCTTFTDDIGDPSKRKAAWVSLRLSMIESNDSVDGEGGMLDGRSKSWEDGEGSSEDGEGGLTYEFLCAWLSNTCTSFLTGLLRLTIGPLLNERPSDGAVASAVIFIQSIGQVPVISKAFLMFSGVKACWYGPEIASRNSLLVILPALYWVRSSMSAW